MAPDAEEAVKVILLQMAPEKIRIDFILSKTQLEDIAAVIGQEEKEKFAKNFSKYHHDIETTGGSLDTFQECKHWIEQRKTIIQVQSSISTGTTNRVLDDGSFLLLASVMVLKDTTIAKIFFPTMNDLGIGDYVHSAEPGEHEKKHYRWPVQEKVGENMYCGIHDDGDDDSTNVGDDDDDDDDGVHWNMYLKTRDTKEEAGLSQRQRDERRFRKLLKDQAVASKERGNPKSKVLLNRRGIPINDHSNDDEDSDEDSDENRPQTSEYIQPLWLPEDFNKHHSRIAPHLSWGEGECSEVQKRLAKGTTDSGNMKADLFKYELQYAKQISSVREKFCAILALSLAATNDDYWMHDNECPGDVEKSVKGLATIFRNHLLKEDDAILGIGLEDGLEEETDDNGVRTSRVLLYQFMDGIAKTFENHVSKFQWKPPSKKRKHNGR